MQRSYLTRLREQTGQHATFAGYAAQMRQARVDASFLYSTFVALLWRSSRPTIHLACVCDGFMFCGWKELETTY